MFVLAVVLLNLLIAIVSDEFDQFMERANLEAQLALASMCKEAQQVRGLGPKTRPDLFPRHLYILQVSLSLRHARLRQQAICSGMSRQSW